jgi:hypothetical protein
MAGGAPRAYSMALRYWIASYISSVVISLPGAVGAGMFTPTAERGPGGTIGIVVVQFCG